MPKVVDNRNSIETSPSEQIQEADIAFTSAPDVLNFSFNPEAKTEPSQAPDAPIVHELRSGAELPAAALEEIDRGGAAYVALEKGATLPADVQASHLVFDISQEMPSLREAIRRRFEGEAAAIN